MFEEYSHPAINFLLSNTGMPICEQLAADIIPEQLVPAEKYKTNQIDIFDFMTRVIILL